MAVETIFATGYFVCALLALVAHVARREVGAKVAGSFWARIGLVTGIFAVLRLASAHLFVAAAMRSVSYSEVFPNGFRPGQFAMLLGMLLVAVTLAGLLLLTKKRLPTSVFIGASSFGVLVLLAMAHSASLYFTGEVLQAKIGSFTVSRIIEGLALLSLAGSCVAFARGARITVPMG